VHHLRTQISERHGSFIFPLVNKSAGIWLIGISMNAKTVLHRAFRRWRRITAASCLRSCCTANALSQNTTHTISGFKYRLHTSVFPFRFTCILSLIIRINSGLSFSCKEILAVKLAVKEEKIRTMYWLCKKIDGKLPAKHINYVKIYWNYT